MKEDELPSSIGSGGGGLQYPKNHLRLTIPLAVALLPGLLSLERGALVPGMDHLMEWKRICFRFPFVIWLGGLTVGLWNRLIELDAGWNMKGTSKNNRFT